MSKDFNALLVMICVAAALTVVMDVFVWRKTPPFKDPSCIKPEPRNPKANEIYLNGCIK